MQVIFYILLNILRDNSPEHACDFCIVRNMKKNKLLQIKRRFSRMDLFSKMECAGGT